MLGSTPVQIQRARSACEGSKDQVQVPRGRGVSGVMTHRLRPTSKEASGVSRQMSSAPQATGAGGRQLELAAEAQRVGHTLISPPLSQLPSGPRSPLAPCADPVHPALTLTCFQPGILSWPQPALSPPHGQSIMLQRSSERSQSISHRPVQTA